MPARALSTATISFGLVSIPVKLYSAAEPKSALSFNQIDSKDGSRVKQQLVNSRRGEVVAREELVKGYEFAKGQYVLFEPDELKALEAAATHTIDIVEFLKADQIDRQYLDKVYYLGTDKGGARAYKLLAQALNETRPHRHRQVRRTRQAVPRAWCGRWATTGWSWSSCTIPTSCARSPRCRSRTQP